MGVEHRPGRRRCPRKRLCHRCSLSDKLKIGQTVIPRLSVGSPDFGSRYVYATWKNQGDGIYLIEFEIDPSYAEANRLNNAATRAIIVGPITSQQGAISGQVTSPWGALAT